MRHIPIALISLTIACIVGNFVWTKVIQRPETVQAVPVAPVKTDAETVLELADSNGFKPTKRVVQAIVNASRTHGIDIAELTAIGIVETGLGKYAKTRRNKNGTYDHGLFQINTVNHGYCIEYNLESPEGSALCAAKLLARIKKNRADYLGVYHSKTPTKKEVYMRKLSNVLQK